MARCVAYSMAIFLTACAAPVRLPSTVESSSPSVSAVDELLQYADALSTLPLADIREQLDIEAAKNEEEPSATGALRLAILNLVAPLREASAAEAELMLADVAGRTGKEDAELAALARLLLAALRAAPVSDPALVLAPAAPATLVDNDSDALRAELAEERARVQRLAAQLEALLRLEEELDGRIESNDVP